MAADAIEVVRRFCEALADSDLTPTGDLFARDGVWYGTRGGLDEERVLRGPDGIAAYFTEVNENWEELRVELGGLRAEGDTVVAFWREIGRNAHSAVEMRTEMTVVFTVRDGMIVSARGYLDRDEALAAAGFS